MKTEIKKHGIIRREKRSIKFPCAQSEFEKFDKYSQENPCDLNSGLNSYTEIAEKELDKNNISSEWSGVLSELRKQEECSPAWYALEIIFCAHYVREHVANNNAEDAAYMMGLLVQRAWNWSLRSHEKEIFAGISLSLAGKKGRRRPKYDWDKINQVALTIYKDNPSVINNWSELARKVKRRSKTDASIKTIARNIKNLIN